MTNATSAASNSNNPSSWIISTTREGDRVVGVSVRRVDGLPFEDEYLECHMADYVREVMATRGVDVGNQVPTFMRGRKVCVILDA